LCALSSRSTTGENRTFSTPFHGGNALRRATMRLGVWRGRPGEHAERAHGAAPGREHRIDQQHVAVLTRGSFGVIPRGHGAVSSR
jgi:hypothetical protein